MLLLADFLLTSDMRLPKGEKPLVLRGPDGSTTLTLSNARDDGDPVGGLAARLLFEAEGLEGSREIAEKHLGSALNALSFTTCRNFEHHSLKVIIEWTPGLSMRQAHYYVTTPVWALSEPALGVEYAASAQHFWTVQAGERQQAALRWFRRGIGAVGVDDQFSYLWFALEIASESLKDKVKVPSACPHCRGPLYCESCGTHPVHRKYPGQAIQATVARYVRNDPDTVFNTLQKIRHSLMHGERVATVIDTLPVTEEQALSALEYVTRHALFDMISLEDPNAPDELAMGYLDDVIRKKVIAAAHVTTGMGGDPNDPQPENIPSIHLNIIHPDPEADPSLNGQ